jgi:WD40 repeat protein
MTTRCLFALATLLGLTAPTTPAQGPAVGEIDREPLFRLEAEGPTSFVTALALSPDGNTLYAGGWDKVVRVWNRDARTGQFALDRAAYRVPIGPGISGAINAIALSGDGTWLAVAGRGMIREGAGFRQLGVILPRASVGDEVWEDEGTIYVVNTKTRAVRLLRGHLGPVLSLAFAPVQQGKPPVLVSAAQEWIRAAARFAGVVRLWNASDGTMVARLSNDLPIPETRPGLAVQHTGRELKQVQVALAWMDGRFRLWDVARDRLWEAEPGKYNNTVAVLPGREQALLGSTDRIGVWNLLPDAQPRPDTQRQFAFPAEKELHFFPRALSLVSSRGDGQLDLAAVIVRRLAGREQDDWLYLLDLAPKTFGASRARVPLWRGGGRLPVIAASPSGRHVAVAGSDDHAIAVFALQDLLAGRPQPQWLRGSGATPRYVAFVTNGKDTGLVLNEKPRARVAGPTQPGEPGDLIFDFARRTLTDNASGWSVWAPRTDGWRVTVAPTQDRKGPSAAVYRGDRLVRTLQLTPDQVVSASALLPPGPFPVPLVALAFDEVGETILQLYNAETGEPVRQFTGHNNLVRSLAFAADGQLLASAGEDQTVCVWSLADLNEHLGQKALLRGVAVQERDGALVVGYVDPAQLSPGNRNRLQVGDVVEGIEDEPFTTLTAMRAFTDAVAVRKPGSRITLRVRDSRGQRRPVALVLSQGVDERKPLLSLFVTRGGSARQREWLGWNPLGFYESSGPRADRHFGWHFNRGDPAAPTAFALAEEYRKDHYREGILKHLMDRRSLVPALQAWEAALRSQKLPKPTLTLWIEDESLEPRKADGQGRVLVQEPGVRLKLAIDNFPLDRIEALSWQFDDTPARRFDRGSGRDRSADLSELAWTRGDHRLRAVLRTLEDEPQTHVQEVTVRYQPKPPTILAQAPARQVVEKAEFSLQALVKPGLPGEEVLVRLVHRHKAKEIHAQQLETKPRQELAVHEALRLEPGDNLIEVVAVNKDALRGSEEFETGRLAIQVRYTPPKVVPPPSIVLEKVVVPDADTDGSLERIVQPNQTVIVHSPRVRLLGQIRAADNLTRAAWTRDETGTMHKLARFDPQKKELLVQEELKLEPGTQRFRFVAKTATSPEAEAVVSLEYRPLLPQLALTPLEPVLYEGQDKPEVLLQGRLTPARHPHPFTAVVVANGQEVKPSVDEQTLTATVPLQPGENRIHVRLSNPWHMAAGTEHLHVRYVRPPRITGWEGVQQSKDPLVSLVARVDSATPLVAESVQATVNGRSLTSIKLFPPQKGEESRAWRVRLDDVPLEKGANEVRLFVSNTEARSRQPGEFALTYAPVKPPALPVVELLNPAADIKMTDPDLKVRFRVRSETPFRKVELVREGRAPLVKSFDLAKLRPDREGWYVLEERIELVPKDNRFQVKAVNPGGERSAAVAVNYLQQPVRLAIDRLISRGPEAAAFVPEVKANGVLDFALVPHGRVWLEGRVIWDQESDEELRAATQVHVFVNGFPQLPADLKPAAGNRRERAFRSPIVLSRAQGNLIEIALPAYKQECANRRDFQVDCAQPVPGQRLHVLIISAGEKDEQKLRDRVAQTVQTPAFSKVHVHGCLVGYVNSRMIFTQLHDIQDRIASLKRNDLRSTEAFNDVVLVYFQGAEAISPDGHFFLTSVAGAAKRRETPISCESFTSRLASALGAQVLLLDVARTAATGPAAAAPKGKDELADCGDDFRVSVLRSAWQGRVDFPEEALLLTAWEEGMTRAIKLKDLASLIETRYKMHVAPTYPHVEHQQHLPSALEELVVGGKR